ncbi:hypothetical protein LINGRAHAP2_LOCUS23541 [Linum grandiflorum]
MLYRD